MSVIERLKEIKLNSQPKNNKNVKYKGSWINMNTFEIDLDLLEFNPYNTRIVSDTQEYSQIHMLADFTDLDKEKQQTEIESILWNKFKAKNKKTEKDILLNGQIEPGVVTSDGLVVDGNRRFMILRRILDKKGIRMPFNAVILDEKYTDNPQAARDIKMLETGIQLGSDPVAAYDPIDKYIRVKDFKDSEGMNFKNIADTMGVDHKEAEKLYNVANLMEEYLSFHGFKNIYSRLNNTEDLFRNFENTLSLYNDQKGLAQWDFKKTDVDDYKDFGFYLIRWTYNNPGSEDFGPKDIRKLYFKNSRTKTIFSNEEMWSKFTEDIDTNELDSIIDHRTIADDIKKYNNQGYTIKEAAEKVDREWAEGADDMFKEALYQVKKKIDNKKLDTKPSVLLEDAYHKLEQLVADKDILISKGIAEISDDALLKLSSHSVENNKKYSNLIRKISEKIKKGLKNF